MKAVKDVSVSDDSAEAGIAHVRVDLSRGDRCVAEQPLYEADVHARFQEERSGRMPQHVGRNPPFDSRGLGEIADAP